jgi:hypothetical protein
VSAIYRAAVTGPDERRAGRLLAVAIGLSLAGVFGLAYVLYGMPAAHWSTWGANAPGAAHFARAFSIRPPTFDEATFVRWLQVCLVAAWLGYGAALVLGHARPPRAGTIRVAAVAAVAMAVIFPPALSCDVYGYLAYARLPLVHGLNPYTHSQQVLRAAGDPVAPFLQWDLASPYGPLWTLLSMAVVGPLRGASLFAQVLALKLLAAGGLIGLTVLGADLAERLAPGRGSLAALAIGFNPLLLIEGPGSGHNDLAMLVPLVASVLVFQRGRPTGAAALLGLSVAIKLITVIALPWLLLLRLREAAGRGRALPLMVLAALGPAVVLQLCFGTAGRGLLDHLTAHGGIGTAMFFGRRWPLGLLLVLSCLWVYRRACVPAVTLAWVVVSTAAILLGGDVWYPWYVAWPLALALVRWQRPGLPLVIATNVLALAMMSFYAR